MLELYQEREQQRFRVAESWYNEKRFDNLRSPRSWQASQRHLKRRHRSKPCIPVRNGGCIFNLFPPEYYQKLLELFGDDAYFESHTYFDPVDFQTAEFADVEFELELDSARYYRRMPRLPQSAAIKIGSRGRRRKPGHRVKKSRRVRDCCVGSLRSAVEVMVIKGYLFDSILETFGLSDSNLGIVVAGQRDSIRPQDWANLCVLASRMQAKASKKVRRQSLELDGIWNRLPWLLHLFLQQKESDLYAMLGSDIIQKFGLDNECWEHLPLGVQIYFASINHESWRGLEFSQSIADELIRRYSRELSQSPESVEFLVGAHVMPVPVGLKARAVAAAG